MPCAIRKNWTDVLDQLVDMILFSKLRDVDLDSDPLVAFSCGHSFTMSNADGFMGLDDVYEKNESTGSYVAPKPVIVSTVSSRIQLQACTHPCACTFGLWEKEDICAVLTW